MNVAVLAPSAIVTEAGTLAEDWLLVSVTAIPPEGAIELIVTVPVDPLPPATLVGLRVKAVSLGLLIVSAALSDAAPSVAVTCAVFEEATGVVVTVNVAEVAPTGTVTVAGTVATV